MSRKTFEGQLSALSSWLLAFGYWLWVSPTSWRDTEMSSSSLRLSDFAGNPNLFSVVESVRSERKAERFWHRIPSDRFRIGSPQDAANKQFCFMGVPGGSIQLTDFA
jgi:hypothetical protein